MTKNDIINLAFEELGFAGYVFDLSAEQQQSALSRLDMMMAQWSTKGIRVGYNGGDDTSPATPLGVTDLAHGAMYLNLAVLLGPMLGKQVSPETKIAAKQAYDALLSRAAMPMPIQLQQLPAGAGHKRVIFTTPPTDRLEAGPDAELEFI